MINLSDFSVALGGIEIAGKVPTDLTAHGSDSGVFRVFCCEISGGRNFRRAEFPRKYGMFRRTAVQTDRLSHVVDLLLLDALKSSNRTARR